MPRYESHGFEPPAPVVRAVVRGSSGVAQEVPLLIDTGADGSVIPLAVAQAVGSALRPSHARIQTYGGAEVQCDQADFSVEFLRFRIEGPFLVAESDVGVLGRNVLNNLVLTLDGPALTWDASGRKEA